MWRVAMWRVARLGGARSGVGWRGAREDGGQPVAVLGEESGLPPAATALVEQVGERILVVARALGEPEDDGLVFFHASEKESRRR